MRIKERVVQTLIYDDGQTMSLCYDTQVTRESVKNKVGSHIEILPVTRLLTLEISSESP